MHNQDWAQQMEQLVKAYLQYNVYNDGELWSNLPHLDNPSVVFEMDVIDVFCKDIHFYQDKCLT